jgi:hypothetical protein
MEGCCFVRESLGRKGDKQRFAETIEKKRRTERKSI